jgi:apolipoprotein N-acyltransferase
MEGYVRRSRLALATHPDLVIWPEASTPQPLLLDEMTFAQVKELASGTPADFLIGSVHYVDQPRGDYNSAILLTHHATDVQVYNKIHLVPFGEFVPFRHTFPLFAWIVGKQVPYDFDSGKGPAVLELSGKSGKEPVKIGTLICFEDTLGDLTRRFAGLGAQLLITITNDGWFEHSVATRQHLANAQLRTVETGLPLVRVADTGVSCWIDSFGRVKEILQDQNGNTFIEGVLSASIPVPLHPKPTFYTQHGELFVHACLAVTLAFSVLGLRKRKRKGL